MYSGTRYNYRHTLKSKYPQKSDKITFLQQGQKTQISLPFAFLAEGTLAITLETMPANSFAL